MYAIITRDENYVVRKRKFDMVIVIACEEIKYEF